MSDVNFIFLYPGQGSQTAGMSRDLVDTSALARQRYAQAAEVLGFDLAKICSEGSDDELRQTRVTQPALFVHSCILTELLAERGVKPAAAAGHSLGEYSALAAAEALSFEQGLRLVMARANAMQHAGEVNHGTMAAIVGLDDDAVRDVCRAVGDVGIVVPANYNSPGQLVVSGEVSAVRKAVELAKTRGARLAKELAVSGAFHSPLMKPAAEALTLALTEAAICPPKFPVVSNVTAKAHRDVTSVRRLLAEQLLSPVRWTESLHELANLTNGQWIEVGSGNVLAGLLKRTIKGANVQNAGSLAEVDLLCQSIEHAT